MIGEKQLVCEKKTEDFARIVKKFLRTFEGKLAMKRGKLFGQ